MKEASAFGIIFDMNGTVVDDAKYQRDAWKAVCSKYGRVLTDEEYSRHVAGHNEADILSYLFGSRYTPSKARKIAEEKRQRYKDTFDPVMAEVPGLRTVLTDLKKSGIPIGLATSASQTTMDFILDKLAIRSYFQTIVRGTEVARGKPAPDIYLYTSKAIGVSARKCIVFEDSLAGIESAKAADMVCIGLATALSPEALLAKGADIAIYSFAEIKFHEIASLIADRNR